MICASDQYDTLQVVGNLGDQCFTRVMEYLFFRTLMYILP